jgi:C4-dicarboxylate transporter DctM subunit
MFLAGIGPGIVLALFFIIFSIIYVKFFNKEVVNVKSTLEEKIKYTKKGLPILLMAFIMLGGIYAGIYTPTEAGGIGFLISFIYVVAKKRLSFKGFIEAGLETMKTTVTIFIIIAGAKIFGKAISLYRIPQELSSFIVTNINEQGIVYICSLYNTFNSWIYNGDLIFNINYDANFFNLYSSDEYRFNLVWNNFYL